MMKGRRESTSGEISEIISALRKIISTLCMYA